MLSAGVQTPFSAEEDEKRGFAESRVYGVNFSAYFSGNAAGFFSFLLRARR